MLSEVSSSINQMATCDDTPSERSASPMGLSSTGEKTTRKRGRAPWGRELPQPRTNLPPRKRAKTADEREQREIERVLRNRRSAQNSRERKRVEMEALQQRVAELEQTLRVYLDMNNTLVKHIVQAGCIAGVETQHDVIPCASRPSHVANAQGTSILEEQFQALGVAGLPLDVVEWLMEPSFTDLAGEYPIQAGMASSVDAGGLHMPPWHPTDLVNSKYLDSQASERSLDSSLIETQGYNRLDDVSNMMAWMPDRFTPDCSDECWIAHTGCQEQTMIMNKDEMVAEEWLL